MDRLKAAMSTADALRARLAKGTERSGRSSRELVARLALQLHLIKEGMRDVHEQSPIEVALQVEPALERAGDREAVRAWCARCWACTARGPRTGTCNSRRWPVRHRVACRCS